MRFFYIFVIGLVLTGCATRSEFKKLEARTVKLDSAVAQSFQSLVARHNALEKKSAKAEKAIKKLKAGDKRLEKADVKLRYADKKFKKRMESQESRLLSVIHWGSK